VPASEWLAQPIQLQAIDLGQASLVVMLDETQHRPMLKRYFPNWEQKVIYWKFEDDYLRHLKQVLPAIKEQVNQLLLSLLGSAQ
jgi:protein-tyrosine phosphatase